MVANTPGLTEILQRDWRMAVTLYARHGVTEGLFDTKFRRRVGLAKTLRVRYRVERIPGAKPSVRRRRRNLLGRAFSILQPLRD